MQAFLSLADSDRSKPKENFARELMELFTRGAGDGYTESDVREAARALTGWTGHWRDGLPFTVSYEARSPEVEPFGGRRVLRVTLLRSGTYRLLCMVPGHAALGMRPTLRIRRPRAR